MTRGTKTRGKRPLEDADTHAPSNGRQAKRPSPGDESDQESLNENTQAKSRKKQADHNPPAGEGFVWGVSTENDSDPENPKGLRGPDNNLRVPDILPREAEAAADADLILRSLLGLMAHLEEYSHLAETHGGLKTTSGSRRTRPNLMGGSIFGRISRTMVA